MSSTDYPHVLYTLARCHNNLFMVSWSVSVRLKLIVSGALFGVLLTASTADTPGHVQKVECVEEYLPYDTHPVWQDALDDMAKGF